MKNRYKLISATLRQSMLYPPQGAEYIGRLFELVNIENGGCFLAVGENGERIRAEKIVDCIMEKEIIYVTTPLVVYTFSRKIFGA